MSHMNPDMAELSRTIDSAELGRRIRAARLAAGLTQAEVAGDDMSTAYVSRIEDGQRRPAAGLLGRMAERLSTTVEELLVGVAAYEQLRMRVQVDHAELSLAAGNAQDALTQASTVLEELAGKPLVDLRRDALQVRAFALEATGDLQGAIEVLEELTADARADRGWLKALIGLSRCYRDSGDLNRAIAVGERAEATIDELGIQGLTEAIQLTLTVAGAYMVRGDTAYALLLCKRSIAAAEKHDSPLARASAYWNASLLEARRGSPESAFALAQKAIALFEASEDARNLGRLRAQIAEMQLSITPPDVAGALATLARAETEMAWSPTSPVDVARQQLTRSRAHFLLDQPDQAANHLAKALELAPKDARVLRASALALEGEIFGARGRTDDARRAYQRAVYELSAIGADRDAAQLWFELGSLLAEVGDTEGAVDAFQRAGASTGLRRSRTAATSPGEVRPARPRSAAES